MQLTLAVCWLSTCSSMELIRSTSQSMRKRFSCRRSISSMMRLYSVGSTMFPTERAVTCQLLATADSMMAWRIANPAGPEEKKTSITQLGSHCRSAFQGIWILFRQDPNALLCRYRLLCCCTENSKSCKDKLRGYSGSQQSLATCLMSVKIFMTLLNKPTLHC